MFMKAVELVMTLGTDTQQKLLCTVHTIILYYLLAIEMRWLVSGQHVS